MCLWWLCPTSHQTEVSFFSRLCHWRRFPAKPVHPRAPSLPETTQPISYPGAGTWGWTKHAFSNLKALVCMSLKTWVDGVLSRPFLLVYLPTDFVCCYFSDYFKELGVNWNLAVVTLTSRGRKCACHLTLGHLADKIQEQEWWYFSKPGLSAVKASWVFALHQRRTQVLPPL